METQIRPVVTCQRRKEGRILHHTRDVHEKTIRYFKYILCENYIYEKVLFSIYIMPLETLSHSISLGSFQ